MSARTPATGAPPRAHAVVAVHVFLTDGERVLLLRRANTGYQDGRFTVVAGHAWPGERVVEAALREAREETGVALDPGAVRVVAIMQRRAPGGDRIDFFVEAPRWQGEPHNAEPATCSELRWCDMFDLPGDTVPYVRRAIANYCEGRLFESYGWEDDAAR